MLALAFCGFRLDVVETYWCLKSLIINIGGTGDEFIPWDIYRLGDEGYVRPLSCYAKEVTDL